MTESPLWLFPLSSSATVGLIDAYDHRVAANSLSIEHPNPPFAAWLVRRGSVTVKFLDATKLERAVTAQKNQWLFLPARPRLHKMTPGTHLLSVRMTLEHAHGAALLTACRALSIPESRIPELAPIAVRVAELILKHHEVCDSPAGLAAQQKFVAEIALRSAFLLWIKTYLDLVLSQGWRLTDMNPPTAPVERVLHWIQQQGFSTPLRQSDMIPVAGLSLSHLKRIFRRELGFSPIAWWQNRRFKEACRLLRGTDLPLKAIAGSLAFRFPSHFSIWFRERTGMSPLEFRRHPKMDV